MKKKAKVLSAFLAAAMTLTSIPAADVQAADAAEGKGKILSLSFDDETTGFQGSGGMASCSGTPVLSEEAVRGKALQLDGTGSNVLSLTKADRTSLMTGYEEFTISYWSKVDERIDPNWAAWISKNDSFPMEDMNYIGILDRGYQIRTERYLNSRTFDMAADTQPGQWKLVTVVYDQNKTSIYIDGQKKQEKEGSYSVKEILGDDSKFYIGKANWGEEYFKGLIDEFEVYNYALSGEEISDLYDVSQGKLLYLSFDGESDGFQWNGVSVEKRSDMEGKSVTLADGYAGQALRLDAADKNYLSIAREDGSSLLTGYKELTISYWSKADSGTWTAFAEPEEGGVTWGSDRYLGIMDMGDSVTVERYLNGRPDTNLNAAAAANEWKFVTAVVKENETELYINGEKKSTVPSTRALTDILGANSHFYIGKASWEGGEYFTGLIDEYSIYGTALTENQIRNLYLGRTINDDGTMKSEDQQRTFDSLTLDEAVPDGAVLSEDRLALPAEVNGAAVVWRTDREDIIARDGTVNLPQEDAVVKLTAVISKDGTRTLKDFFVPVIAGKNLEAHFTENFHIPSVLADGMKLDDSFGSRTVEWSGAGVDAQGNVTARTEDQSVTLTAKLGDTETQKSFPVKILKKGSMGLAAYTRTPKDTDTYSGKLAYSVHLAYSRNGEAYTELNGNSGILYAKATVNSGGIKPGRVNPKNLKNPYLFYRKDGSYGIVAVRTDSDQETMCNKGDEESRGKVLLFTTSDFVKYQEIGLIDLKKDAMVSDITCDYDSALGSYILRWCDTEGNYYKNIMEDVADLDSASEAVQGTILSFGKQDVGAEGAYGRNEIYVPEETGAYAINKLTKLHNTGVDVPESITASSAQEVQGTKVTLKYSDGSTAKKSVDWDLSGVDFDKAGAEYQVSGTVKTAPSMKVDVNPLAEERADPCVYYRDGFYYFIATDDGATGNGSFFVRKAPTIEGLAAAEDHEILSLSQYADINGMLWAPEFHVLNGETYIFFSTNPGDGWNVQSHVMKLKKGGDLTKKEDWEKPILFLNKEGQPLTNSGIGGITLDMTTFHVNGHQYVMWSQRDFGNETGAWIYIGEIDPAKPWQLTSDSAVITQPDYGWDNNASTPVDEGPYAIITNDDEGNVDKVFVTFSGSAVGATYCVGLLEVRDVNKSLLDPKNWTKWNYPIVDAYSVDGECGPGHNSYTTDEDGNLVFVYHARPIRQDGSVGPRNSGLRTVHFDAEGYPVLYMTEDLELAEENRTVSTKIIVKGEAEDQAVKDAIEKIHAIGQVQYNDASRKKIEEARAAYDALSSEQKKQVTNYSVLADAQARYELLKKEQEQQKPQDPQPQPKPQENAVKKGQVYEIGNYKYKVTNADTTGKGTVTLAGVKNRALKSLKAADTVKIQNKTFKVTAIGKAAFKNCKKAVRATIGKNIKTIGNKAFYQCRKLKKITVKSKVLKKVKKNAFKGTHSKARIKVPAKKLKAYTKLMSKKGQSKRVKIVK